MTREQALEAALKDAMSALDYVRYHYGELYGVGFERVRNNGDAALAMTPAQGVDVAFQDRVQPWMMACFGAEISADRQERNHRFLEEALELVQACGCTQSEAHQLVDYVYGRPQGDINQEVGGVMVTLAAHCLAHGVDMHKAGETELARVWTKVEAIRAKQAAKPKHSPLPGPTPPVSAPWTPPEDRPDGYMCWGWVGDRWLLVHWVPNFWRVGALTAYPTAFAPLREPLQPAPEASHE